MDTDRLPLLFPSRRPAPEPPKLEDPLVPLPRVAAYFGVSLRTIDRWLVERPELNFPKPQKIAGRRYLRLSQIVGWEPPGGQEPEAA
jgi:predicted DNA-binding transcriptional regulator AlpA